MSVLLDADRRYRDSAQLEQDRQFWLDTMTGPGTEPGSGHPAARRLPPPSAQCLTSIGPDESFLLKAAARRHQASFVGLMIAAGAIYHLDLCRSSADDRVAEEIAGAPHLAGLRTLNLSETAVTDDGAKALVASPHLGQLRRLVISTHQIGPAVRRLLKERFGESVQFSDRPLGTKGS